MSLDQIGIVLTGLIAVWLTQDKREGWRRWACVFGMLAQPPRFPRNTRTSPEIPVAMVASTAAFKVATKRSKLATGTEG